MNNIKYLKENIFKLTLSGAPTTRLQYSSINVEIHMSTPFDLPLHQSVRVDHIDKLGIGRI